ncbi:hypothetical protein [Lignipirellula cremea]|nr:hypothetical protein [Lignipirellula cremea]
MRSNADQVKGFVLHGRLATILSVVRIVPGGAQRQVAIARSHRPITSR